MNINKIGKLIGLNFGIAIVDIVLFSEGLLHIQIGGNSVLQTAIGITVVLMSILIFLYGNYQIVMEKKERIPEKKINTPEECLYALKQHKQMKTFTREIDLILEQIQRLSKKKVTIEEILLQKFNQGEMSFQKFENTVSEVEQVFYINIKSIINKLNAFDEEDYIRIQNESAKNELSQEFIKDKMNIYNEFILFVKDSIEDNEQILLKLDQLLLELSRFNSLEDGEIENLSAMKEIDDLISKTKFYK